MIWINNAIFWVRTRAEGFSEEIRDSTILEGYNLTALVVMSVARITPKCKANRFVALITDKQSPLISHIAIFQIDLCCLIDFHHYSNYIYSARGHNLLNFSQICEREAKLSNRLLIIFCLFDNCKLVQCQTVIILDRSELFVSELNHTTRNGVHFTLLYRIYKLFSLIIETCSLNHSTICINEVK